MRSTNRFIISSREIASMLSPSGRRKFWYDTATGKVPDAVRNESGWGHTIRRKGFEQWLAEHPQCAATATQSATPAPESQP